jgi:outer membrane protein TolC
MLRAFITLHLALGLAISLPAREIRVPLNDDGSVDWSRIETLDLVSAQEITLLGNPSLAAAGERVTRAAARVSEARSAYWPRLDASASYSYVDFAENATQGIPDPSDPFVPSVFADPEDFYRAGLFAGWVLFDGLAREYSNSIAKFGEMESEAAYLEARRLLLSSVANAYYSAQLARANIAIAEADEAFNQRQYEEARARREKGTGSLSEELNFEVRMNQAKSARITAERVSEVARIGLAELMGLPEGVLPEAVDLPRLDKEQQEELETPLAGEEVEFALAHRPDLARSEFALEQARAGIGFARSDYYPSLNLSASVDGTRENSGRFEGDDFGGTVALSLSINVFDGFGRRARVKGAKAALSESEWILEETRIAVAADVRTALARLRSAQQELILQRENTVLVERTRDLVEKEYAAGQASLVRLNEAQRDLTSARSRLVLALVSLRQAWHDLETATGKVLIAFSE